MRKYLHLFLVCLGLVFIYSRSVQAQCSSVPLSYCGKTDTNVYSSAAPTLGAMNTSTVDPDFGGKVLRVTQDQDCGQAAGVRFGPDDGSGGLRGWNVDDSKVLIVDELHGGWYYKTFNTGAFTVGACVAVIPDKMFGFPNFSWVTTNRIWGLGTGGKNLVYWDTTAGSATVVFDMSTIPGFTWTSSYLIEGDGNDQWFCTANNSQGVGKQIGCYNFATTNTQVLDLNAATEQQNSGAPVALDNLSSAQLADCTVHSFQWDRSSTWLEVTTNLCSAFPNTSTVPTLFWQVGTNHITYFPDKTLDIGHESLGFSSAYINQASNSPPCSPYDARGWKLWFASSLGTVPAPKYVEINTCTGKNDGLLFGGHSTWLNNKNDGNVNAYPIIVEPYVDAGTGVPTQYMQWEIDALQTSPALTLWNANNFGSQANGVVWRLAHTNNDGDSNQCPESAYVSPNVSRDGKYVSFLSDWFGQTGTGACTNSRRVDMFILDTTTSSGGPTAAGIPLGRLP